MLLDLYFTSIFFVIGISLASFGNALSYRLKENKNFINDRSECPSCKHKLSALDLVPIFSYIYLKGKCRYCKSHISILYPIIELMGGIFTSIIGGMALSGCLNSYEVALYILFGFASLVIFNHDIKYLEIPDSMQVILFILAIANLFISELNIPFQIFSGMLAGILFLTLFKFTGEEKMGFGDVKLAFILGFYFNFFVFIIIVLGASLGGIIWGVLMSKFTHTKIDKVKVPLGSLLVLVSCLMLILLNFNIEVLENYKNIYEILF